jgi:hypothetical protein
VISLLSIWGTYMIAVMVGARVRKLSTTTYLLLGFLVLVQVAVVLAAMFLMDPPSMSRGNH